MKTKKILLYATMALLILPILVLGILAKTSPVNANYQSVYTTGKYTDNVVTTWLPGIRNMEASGQVMGLTERKNADLTSTTSNNIDVHMLKNTEFGAVAILSASTQYGKQGTGTARYVMNGSGLQTTTGNVYGVYFNRTSPNYEWVAAGGTSSFMNNYAARYYNKYSSISDRKVGDAILAWHGNTCADAAQGGNAVYRAIVSSGVFYSSSSSSGDRASRAAVVCGVGF